MRQIAIGLLRKIVVADVLAVYTDRFFSRPTDFPGIGLLVGAVGYSLQIYNDFAGYSDIAIGAARVLGYDLKENFRAPVLATSLKDFWARWHISLSTWFRDYLERLYELYERHFAGDRTRDPEGGLPPMVLKQLMAMQEACVARGVEMRIAFSPLSHPVSEEYKSRLVAQLGQTFPDIGESLANIRMEPSANFKDGIHFTRDHLLEERVRLRAELLGLK